MATQTISLSDILPPSDATIAAVLQMPNLNQFDEYGDNGIDPVADAVFSPAVQMLAVTQEEKYSAVQKMMDASDLINKTVFLKTRFGSLGNSRKVAGSEVLETDADVTLLKVSKTLLESPELDAIRKSDGMMRKWLGNTCLPFDMGIMLLPIGLVDKAEAKMKDYEIERAALVETFIKAYDVQRDTAASHLGSLYNLSDYPSVDEIRAKFKFKWQYTTFSVPGSLKNISAALFEAEQEKAAATMQAATEEITAIMRETMFKLVSHLQDKLSPGDDGKSKILKEAAVKNLTEFLDTFDLRNVTNDVELAIMVKKARELLNGTSATAIRSSDILKAKTLTGLDNIMDTLSSMVQEKPGRMFKDED